MRDAMVVGFATLFGLAFGSFLNVVLYRAPRHERVSFPPSHCPACATRLRWPELVPVASWVALRGRCRTCGASISVRYPLIELGCGITVGLAAWLAVH